MLVVLKFPFLSHWFVLTEYIYVTDLKLMLYFSTRPREGAKLILNFHQCWERERESRSQQKLICLASWKCVCRSSRVKVHSQKILWKKICFFIFILICSASGLLRFYRLQSLQSDSETLITSHMIPVSPYMNIHKYKHKVWCWHIIVNSAEWFTLKKTKQKRFKICTWNETIGSSYKGRNKCGYNLSKSWWPFYKFLFLL